AEPIRAENLQAFADKFAPIGFDQKAFISCYGMAESTLAISFSKLGTGVTTDVVDGDALWSEGRAVPIDAESPRAAPIVQCGAPFLGHEIHVFALDDEFSETPLGEREVGEIRLRGPSVTAGYFNETEKTQESFAGGWLRTGDLGYLAGGNVHICGRSKEVIIVNGRNYYPQDLEWEAGKVEGVRKGNVVSFGTLKPHNDRERVVITFETVVTGEAAIQALKGEVRRVVQQALGLTVDDVVPLAPGLLPKTSSGKLQRSKTRALYETGTLLGRTAARDADAVEAAKALARSQLGYFRHALLGGKKSED
ncbi:MAG: AMP-binding protein, partial [Byssovorax sp.]